MGYETRLFIVEESRCSEFKEFVKTYNGFKEVFINNGRKELLEDDGFETFDYDSYKKTAVKKRWSELISVINLCKIGSCHLSDAARGNITDKYVYFNDEILVVDSYGKELTEISLKDAIKALEIDSTNDNYRRFSMALKCLKSFDNDEWRDVKVLVAGY